MRVLGNSATLMQLNDVIEARDSKIYYDTTGTGPSVLFIHAGVADSRMWNAQCDMIDDHRLVRFDMRGFGRSVLGSQPFTHRDDALAVLDRLEIETAVVVGCSIGANIALQLADEAAERVSGLVLVGADAPGFESGIDYESPEWPEAIRAFKAGDMRRTAELEAEVWLAGIGRSCSDLDQATVNLFIDMDLIALRNETRRDELEVGRPLERLPDIGVPSLVIAGERDLPQIVAAAHHLATSISDRPPLVMADTAHLPSMDRPREFSDVILGFLSDF